MTVRELTERLDQLDDDTPIAIFSDGQITDDMLFLVGIVQDQTFYFVASAQTMQEHAEQSDYEDRSAANRQPANTAE